MWQGGEELVGESLGSAEPTVDGTLRDPRLHLDELWGREAGIRRSSCHA